MPVDVTASSEEGLDLERVERAAECVLGVLGCAADELSLAVVDDQAIRALNRDYRDLDLSTDVLSFSQLDDEPSRARDPRDSVSLGSPPRALGDVVISLETAARQADEGGWPLEEEVNRLLVHGVLHLLGHEHERGGEDERRMKAEEARVARELKAAGFGCASEDLT